MKGRTGEDQIRVSVALGAQPLGSEFISADLAELVGVTDRMAREFLGDSNCVTHPGHARELGYSDAPERSPVYIRSEAPGSHCNKTDCSLIESCMIYALRMNLENKVHIPSDLRELPMFLYFDMF